MQPFEYLMPIFADEEDLIASSDNTLGSGEAHGASKDLDICSLKLIGLHHRFQEMEPLVLFLLRERPAHELRQPLNVKDSFCLQVLVPHEKYFVGELDTSFVVAGDVIPVGAESKKQERPWDLETRTRSDTKSCGSVQATMGDQLMRVSVEQRVHHIVNVVCCPVHNAEQKSLEPSGSRFGEAG
nr:hypothetical protein Iba_chr09fCG10640 [Ipomoea batatas]